MAVYEMKTTIPGLSMTVYEMKTDMSGLSLTVYRYTEGKIGLTLDRGHVGTLQVVFKDLEFLNGLGRLIRDAGKPVAAQQWIKMLPGATAPKSPWITTDDAIETLKVFWKSVRLMSKTEKKKVVLFIFALIAELGDE